MKQNYKQKAKKIANSSKEGSNMKNVIIVGAGLTATGIVGYFGYQYYKKLKEQESHVAKKSNQVSTFTPPETDTPPVYQSTSNSSTNTNSKTDTTDFTQIETHTSKSHSNTDSSEHSTYTPPKTKSSFPLKRGSKGIKVRELQDALMATHGKSILPRYGADGDFGSELVNALKKLKYPISISESLFNVIVNATQAESSLASKFYTALNKNDYSATMNLLSQLKSKTDYTTVSTEFLNYRLHGGVRQTLVNGTLNTFSDKVQKQNIRLEFIRMGLKYNGKKWSLDGIDGTKIITIEPTQIWLDGYSSLQVPQNMILGIAHAEKLDFTLFENDNRFFLVKTNAIRKLAN